MQHDDHVLAWLLYRDLSWVTAFAFQVWLPRDHVRRMLRSRNMNHIAGKGYGRPTP
jgi:hypothetical protein